MKKIALFIFTLSTFLVSAQQTESFSYLVGSNKVDGYPIQTCQFDASKYSLVKELSAPILQIYTLKKDSFVGGFLENENGKKTKIKDITLHSSGKTSIFTVVGEGFSRSFTLQTGAILKEEKQEIVFYTTNVGVWKIYKK